MAISLYKGQTHFRAKGQSTCSHHKGGKLDLYCKNCEELACIKCLSTVHNSHPLCALSEITSQQKRDIQNFVNKTERVDLVQVDKYITSTDEQLKDNSRNFEKLSHKLMTHTNELKHDLDLLTAQTLSLYQQMEEENTKLLQTYKQDLEMYSAELKQQVQDCKIVLQRGSDIQIYDTGLAIQSQITLPVKPTLGIAGFTPNENFLVHLEQALGVVNISGQIQGQPLQGHDPTVWSSAGQRQSGTRQRSEIKERTPSTQQRSIGRNILTIPAYTLLPQTKVLGDWDAPCGITSLFPTTNGQVWTSDDGSNTLTLLNRKGKVIQEVKHTIMIRDISQSPTTNTLWVCDYENNITELVSGQLVHRFRTSEFPLCICITATNNVIVGMDDNISKYTTKGKLVLTTSATRTRESLVCFPYRIAECPVTHNVAVVDFDCKRHGSEGKLCVVVIDIYFKELFVYGGEVPYTYQPPGDGRFNPWGLVYDSVGNLVIGDYVDNRILLISGRGKFLRVIHTDDFWISVVGIDREGVLWAACGSENVKLLQYSSV